MNQKRTNKYAIVIDTFKCFDCKACMIACKVENQLPTGYWRNWIRPLWNTDGSGKSEFQPGQCMQCDNPSCVAACPVGATYKQADGLVVIDPKKCVGCGNCVTACPYDARYRNPTTRIADKCDFCSHRLAVEEEPACVVTCPTGIDIRNGLQMECIGCAQCIEACDEVMEKTGKPRGLIDCLYRQTGQFLQDIPQQLRLLDTLDCHGFEAHQGP